MKKWLFISFLFSLSCILVIFNLLERKNCKLKFLFVVEGNRFPYASSAELSALSAFLTAFAGRPRPV